MIWRILAVLLLLLAPGGCAAQAAPPEPVLSSPVSDRSGYPVKMVIPGHVHCLEKGCRA